MANFKLYLKKIYFEKFLFLKIQSFITLIVLVPMLIAGYSYYAKSKEILISNFTQTNSNTLKEMSISFDLIINSVIDISKQIHKDTRLFEALKKTELDQYEDKDIIVKKLDQVKYSNRYISSAYIYLEKAGLVFSSEYGFVNADDFRDRHFLDWYRSDDRNIVLADTHSALPFFSSKEPDNMFSVFARIPVDGIKSFNGALVINLRHSMVYNEIINALNINQEVPFYIVDSNNKIILAKDESDLYKDIYSMDYFSKKLEKKSGSFITRVKKGSYLVVYNYLENRGWTYISVYPFSEMNEAIGVIRNLVIFITILLLFLSVLISSYFTLKTFKPVEELNKLINSKIMGKQPQVARLGHIKDAVFEMFSNNEEMQRKLDLTVPVFRERFLINLIKGRYTDYGEVAAKLETFSIDIPENNLILTVFQIDDYEQTRVREVYEDSRIKFSITNMLQEFFAAKEIRAFYVEDDKDSITVVIGKANLKNSDLLVLLKELQHLILEKAALSATVGVCDMETSVTNLGDSYLKAREILKYKVLYGKQEILLYSDIKQEEDSEYAYPYDKEEFLKNYIRIGDQKNALSTFNEILSGVANNKKASYFHIYQLITQLNSSIVSLLNEINIPLEDIYKNKNVIEKLLNLQSPDEIQFFFSSVIEKIISIIQANRESKMDKYYQKITGYIQENYMRELTLEWVSEEINLSPTYINQILKSNMNKTFIQYLNELRIQKACELLDKGDLKIKDVAEQVGYGSSKYFIKMFKEIKGVTPGQYKE
mgnify:CR=1 FL=1